MNFLSIYNTKQKNVTLNSLIDSEMSDQCIQFKKPLRAMLSTILANCDKHKLNIKAKIHKTTNYPEYKRN